MTPEKIVNLQKHPIKDINYRKNCKAKLDLKGALVMENFLTDESLDHLQSESRDLHHLAYFCHQNHNAYLLNQSLNYLMSILEILNRLVTKDVLRMIRSH